MTFFHNSGDFLGGLFDLNGNGRTTSDEVFAFSKYMQISMERALRNQSSREAKEDEEDEWTELDDFDDEDEDWD